MGTIPMISEARQMYAGKPLLPNDPFEALNEQDAEDLICMGWARRVHIAASAPTRDEAPKVDHVETAQPAQMDIQSSAPTAPVASERGQRNGRHENRGNHGRR